MDRRGVLVVVTVAFALSVTGATVNAMQCPGGPATESWKLELLTVTIDGQEVDDYSDYEPLTFWLGSTTQESLRLSVGYDDDPWRDMLYFDPADNLDESDESGVE